MRLTGGLETVAERPPRPSGSAVEEVALAPPAVEEVALAPPAVEEVALRP